MSLIVRRRQAKACRTQYTFTINNDQISIDNRDLVEILVPGEIDPGDEDQ